MLKTFPKGGIHPVENKLSVSNAIDKLPLPETVIIPLSQHIGVPSIPVVTKGEKVKAGQVIARSVGYVSTNIHSSVSGTVIQIDDIMDISGYRKRTIVIKVEGDTWVDNIDLGPDLKEEITFSDKEIINRILESGIVGLGGATFPSHVKLSIPKGKVVEYLIINGVECEPYLTADHRLMLEKGEEILVGIKILMKALHVKKVIIGIENNKQDAIQHLKELSRDRKEIKVCELEVKYPQGSEKHLIKAILNRETPSGGLPIDVGVVVHNVGTVFAVYEAVQKNKPLVERVVTVTGKSLKRTANFLVRIGTPIKNLIEAVGGLPDEAGKVINGGPMMGKALITTDVPVIKGTSGVVVFREKSSIRKEILSCIRCTKCVTACPLGLEPYLLMLLTENRVFDKLEDNYVMDCNECGCCSFICPSNRPLLDYIRLGKATVSQIIRSRKE